MTGTQATSRLVTSTRKRRKQRASFVCQVCQKRKVRCDLSFRTPPCTNCRLDQTECFVPDYRRRRNTPDRPSLIAKPFTPGILSNCLTSLWPSHSERSDCDPSRIGTSPICRPEAGARNMSAYSTCEILVPCFKPLPTSLDKTDLSYLNKKGAFEVPSPSLLCRLLSAYLQFAYGYMPIIDLQDLLGNFTGASSTTVSWLLFQCILFAGVAFVDVLDLAAAGFNSRGEAHDHYFDKAQLLYDFDCEQDPLILIQALAMMSHWNHRYKCHRDSSHWLESSISLAFKHGLHRENLAKYGSMQNDGLRKRIWWSLYSQSRIVSLGMKHPLRSIELQDASVSFLTLADFDFHYFPSLVPGVLHDCSIVRCIEDQKTLAQMFLQKIRLCLSLESAEQVKYGSSSSALGLQSTTPSRSISGDQNEVLEPNALIGSHFEKWYQSINDERSSSSASFLFLSPTDRAIRLYQLHLKLLKKFSRLSAR